MLVRVLAVIAIVTMACIPSSFAAGIPVSPLTTKQLLISKPPIKKICYERNISCSADANCCSGTCHNNYCA